MKRDRMNSLLCKVFTADMQDTSPESAVPDNFKQETSTEVTGQLSSSEAVKQTASSEESVEEAVKEVNRHGVNNADIGDYLEREKELERKFNM